MCKKFVREQANGPRRPTVPWARDLDLGPQRSRSPICAWRGHESRGSHDQCHETLCARVSERKPGGPKALIGYGCLRAVLCGFLRSPAALPLGDAYEVPYSQLSEWAVAPGWGGERTRRSPQGIHPGAPQPRPSATAFGIKIAKHRGPREGGRPAIGS